MSFYLLDHQNPHAPRRSNGKRGWYYPSRRDPLQIIVLHTAEWRLDNDLSDGDQTGEALAAYAARATRPVSWHASVDADSTIAMLPDSFTAFHARNYNSESLGVEMAYFHNRWGSDLAREDAILRRTARLVMGWCRTHDIPPVLVTKAQVDRGERGITYHQFLDPGRRKDPGAGFGWVWERFAQYLAEENGDDMGWVDKIDTAAWVAMGRLFPEDRSFVAYYQPGGTVERNPDPTAERFNAYLRWVERVTANALGDDGAHDHPFAAADHRHGLDLGDATGPVI